MLKQGLSIDTTFYPRQFSLDSTFKDDIQLYFSSHLLLCSLSLALSRFLSSFSPFFSSPLCNLNDDITINNVPTKFILFFEHLTANYYIYVLAVKKINTKKRRMAKRKNYLANGAGNNGTFSLWHCQCVPKTKILV